MRQRGFTLIEMLVVAAILGILVTAAALSISAPRQHDARRAAERLALLLEAAQAEAQAGQRQLAWSTQADGYRFWQAEATPDRNLSRWQALNSDTVFAPQTLQDGLRIGRVTVDAQALPEGELLVLRRGDPPLYRIALEAPATGAQVARRFELRGLPNGRVEILTADAS